ncbi:MAG: dihydropteroate synthase [Planctomycetes bacterium]|nr:dihydropteroate synthase [Planctomycetota bacterium]
MSDVRIIGILNLTRDSFSDGGHYLAADAASAHARRLLADGADVIDLGAESSHPDAEDVSDAEQITRLTPVLESLQAWQSDAPGGATFHISVDTYRPAVMRQALGLGADIINDITALRDPEAVALLRESAARVILMFSRAPSARARRAAAGVDPRDTGTIDEPIAFFERRIADLAAAGIAPQRLILDPGMGFFLSTRPEPSLAVLRGLKHLAALGLPICVSTSRKSFIGAVLGTPAVPRPVGERAAGTLATELWAIQHGAAYIRTHDVRALRDALTMTAAIRAADGDTPRAAAASRAE